MSDARQYAVLQIQDLGHKPWTLKILPFSKAISSTIYNESWQLTTDLISGRIFNICPNYCGTWLWTWQKRQLWRVNRLSRMGLIYLLVLFAQLTRFSLCFSGAA